MQEYEKLGHMKRVLITEWNKPTASCRRNKDALQEKGLGYLLCIAYDAQRALPGIGDDIDIPLRPIL
jgi:hypothetical protein